MISPYTSPLTTMPSQMVSFKEKMANNKRWAKESFNAYESHGRRQYRENMAMIENYQMINGKFIIGQYFDREDSKDWLTELSRELEVPSTLRHYDVIGKIVNNLTEKLTEFPNIFRVQELYQDDDSNEYIRTQTRLMHQAVKATINNEIAAVLLGQGMDVNKQNFDSEEEAMKYQEEVQQAAQALQPAKIQEYMNTSWQSQGEIWGTHQVAVDRERFAIHELRREEFTDMLTGGRCYRHFYVAGDGYQQETWNPIITFSHTSPDVKWVQKGSYVGRIPYMTKSDIFERYGWKMSKKNIKRLEDMDKKWGEKNDLTGFPYNVYAPFADFKAYNTIVQSTGYDPLNKIPVMGNDIMALASGNMPFMGAGEGLYRVTELYWMSQRKIGKVVYFDDEIKKIAIDLVDENFIVPEDFTEVMGDFKKGNEPNTVYWTYANEVWKGTKVAYLAATEDDDAMFIELEPCEFQFKGDYNPFGAQLPVCGRIFNNRNAQSMSLVDFCKPFQIGHNMAMNQLYQLMEKEIGKFVVWDASFFNNIKDWGGEESWDKIAVIAKELGHVFGDTSPQNMKGANPGNQLPKTIDLDLAAQMFSRAKLADFFEAKMMSQLGISPQSMGDIKATETATGINTATNQTQLTVQRYFTDFFEYEQRCLSMGLDIAQYVQSKNKDITIMYTKSDGSREFIRMLGLELLLREIHIYVVNSQELLKQMELIKQWFLQNSHSDVTGLDVLEVVKGYSPAAIKIELQKLQREKIVREQQNYQLQQQAIQQKEQSDIRKEEGLDRRAHEANETKKETAYMSTFIKQTDNLKDTNQDTQPDVLEYGKFNAAQQSNADKISVQRESNQLKRQKQISDADIKKKELELKTKDLKRKEKESRDKVKIAKINPG